MDMLHGNGFAFICSLLALTLINISPMKAVAQENTGWHGRRCAVSLTYDDALNVDLDNVVPLLDSLGLRATFYVTGSFPGFRSRIRDWAVVGKEGHELGNHTLFHPCRGGEPGREWVQPDYDLRTYTIRRITDEMETASTLLEALDGKRKRTFAYPCGDMEADDTSYVEEVAKLFPGARGVEGRMQGLDDMNLYNIGAYLINGQSGDELISLVKKAMESGSFLVFLFHGVGGEHALNVSLQAHRELLYFLKHHENEIWVVPVIDVVEFVKERRAAKK
jgi:peptidoglycan/xylan/chitin deacetylase (PgdA/CDA1 family)